MIGIYFLVDSIKDKDLKIQDLPKENLDTSNFSNEFIEWLKFLLEYSINSFFESESLCQFIGSGML